jgi:hypothetical protein
MDGTVVRALGRSVVPGVELRAPQRWVDRAARVRAAGQNVSDSTENSSLRDLTPDPYDRLTRFEQRWSDYFYERWLKKLGDESSAARNAYIDTARRSLIFFGVGLICGLGLILLSVGPIGEGVGAAIFVSAIFFVGLILFIIRYAQVRRWMNREFGPNTGRS